MKRVPPATSGETIVEQIANAPTVEELAEIRPPWDGHLDGGEHVVRWYNTAPFTAARIFVRASEQSDEFYELFVNDLERPIETADGHVIEVAAWRKVLRNEMPALQEKLDSIGLSLRFVTTKHLTRVLHFVVAHSAAQGGFAENMAREALE